MTDNNKYQPKKIKPKKGLQRKKDTAPTSWDIIEDDNKATLVFYKGDKILTEIEILPETMNDLMVQLSEYIITDNNIADSWTYREPADSELPDYLTLLKEGKILATLPVDDNVGKKLGKSLNKYIEKETLQQRINKFRKTKPKRFYASALFILVISGILIYSILSNIFINLFMIVN